MWNITLRNMQFRARQFLLAIIGTALVFSMALLVTGLKEAFKTEADRALAAIGGDAWVGPGGGAGPVTGFTSMGAARAGRVRQDPRVRGGGPGGGLAQNNHT